MKTPARWWIAGIVVVVALGQVAWTAEPVIDIPQDAAEGALQDSHRQQIDEYVAYYVDELAKATSQDRVVAARRRLTDSYVKKYGTRAREYMLAYAGSTARHGQAMLASLPAEDRMGLLKKVNLAYAASRMGQVSLDPLTVTMVAHPEPALRFLGWEAYVSMRPSVLAVQGKPAEVMFATLSERFQKETDPHVLAQMMKMFAFRGAGDFGGAVSEDAAQDGLGKLFAVLEANWVGLCRKTLEADGTVAEASSVAIDAAGKIKGVLKEKVEDKVLAQMLANMVWSLGKAYDSALAIQQASQASADISAAEILVANDPSPENMKMLDDARKKAQALAEKAGLTVEDLPPAAVSEYTVSAIAKALSDCESALVSLTGARNNFIKKELNSGGAAVRLGTLKWIDDVLVEKYQVKQPAELVTPK